MKRHTESAERVLDLFAEKHVCFFAGPFCLVQENSEIIVKLEVHCQIDGLHLAYIENLKKSGGHAGRILQSLAEIARATGCPIRGRMDTRFGRNRNQLREFYKQCGAKFKGADFTIE